MLALSVHCLFIVESPLLAHLRDALPASCIVLAERRLRHIGDSTYRHAKSAALLVHIPSTPENAPARVHAHTVVLRCPMWRKVTTSRRNVFHFCEAHDDHNF